jgi:hypothetical protein
MVRVQLSQESKKLKTTFLFITGKKKKKKKLKHVPPLSTSIRASARAERAIKKNWTLQNLRNFAGRFQLGQTRRVLSGVKNAGAKFPPSAVKVKKRHF